MKKTALAAVAAVVVAGAWLGATAYTGQRVRAQYDAQWTALEKELPILRVTQREVEAGLLSSRYTVRLQLACAPAAAEGEAKGGPLVLTMEDTVRHGPLPGLSSFGAAQIDTRLALSEQAPEALRKYLAGMKPEDIRTRLSYGGDLASTIRLPAGSQQGAEFDGAWAESRILLNGRMDAAGTLRASWQLPELTLTKHATEEAPDAFALKLVNLRAESEGQGGFSWVQPGRGSTEIERIELRLTRPDEGDEGQTALALQFDKLRYASELTQDKDLMQGTVQMTGEALSVQRTATAGGAAVDGKPLKFTQLELQESVKRLHAPTLREVIASVMAETSRCEGGLQAAKDAEGDEDDDAAEAELSKTLLAWAKLLPYGPELSVDKLALDFGGQRGEIGYSVRIDGIGADDLTLEPSELVLKLKQQTALQAKARIPVAWLEEFAAQEEPDATPEQRRAKGQVLVDLAVGSGFAKQENGVLVSALQYEKGALNVNGKPFAPGAQRGGK